MERREKYFTLFDVHEYSDMPTTLEGMIKLCSEALRSVPQAFRGTIGLEFDSEYDESSCSMEASWHRPETDEEMNQRVAEEMVEFEKRSAHTRTEELRLLAVLKEKYEQ